MNLYKFSFWPGFDNQIERSVLECEEVSGVFIQKDQGFIGYIPKDGIGPMQSGEGLYVLLPEDNFEKARAIYLDYYSREIEIENRRHTQKIDAYNKIIEVIKESKE